MSETIRINFNRPLPLFPLPGVVLLPHAVVPLHIFETRYRQMVDESLDGPRQIAIASLMRPDEHLLHGGNGDHGDEDNGSHTALRPAVCVGHIVKHYPQPDGRHNILVQGICRAKIESVIEPTGDRMYYKAYLSPSEAIEQEPQEMDDVRYTLRSFLRSPNLGRMRCTSELLEWIEHDSVSTHALLELVGFAVMTDQEKRYTLLAESDPYRRAEVITDELRHLNDMIGRADNQSFRNWPKGMSWN